MVDPDEPQGTTPAVGLDDPPDADAAPQGSTAPADDDLALAEESAPVVVDEPDPHGHEPAVVWRRVGMLVLALMVLGFVLRWIDLDGRPLHHDESLDAWFSWKFINGTYDGYDPVYHGPLRFYLTGLFFVLFGESVVTARLISVLAGVVLIGLPWFFRHRLGPAGTVAASALLCGSTAMLYFTRMGREDAFFAALTFGFAVVLFHVLRDPRPWQLPAAGVLVVAMWAVKESVFITLFVFGSFLLVMVGQELFVAREAARRPDEPERLRRIRRLTLGAGLGATLVLFAWAHQGIPRLLGRSVTTICDPPREVVPDSLGLAVAAYVAVLLAFIAVGVLALRAVGRPITSAPTVRALAAIPAGVWLATVLVSAALFVTLFTVFFTNLDGAPPRDVVDVCDADPVNDTNPTRHNGVVDGLIGGFEYWNGEQDTGRGDGRWFYYLVMMGAYEWFPILLALVGAGRVVRRMTFLDQALLWWALTSVMAYSYAGERMPWLVIHPVLPTLLLAGLGVQVLWEQRHRQWLRPVALACTAGAAFYAFSAVATNYARETEPEELFVQAAQASDEVPAWVDRMRALDQLTRAEWGRRLRIGIDADVYWPYGFYVREGWTGVIDPGDGFGTYLDLRADSAPPEGYDIVIVPSSDEGVMNQLAGYRRVPYLHRVWWSETNDWSDGGVGGWLRWSLDRRVWTPTEGLRGAVYLSEELLALEDRAGG